MFRFSIFIVSLGYVLSTKSSLSLFALMPCSVIL